MNTCENCLFNTFQHNRVCDDCGPIGTYNNWKPRKEVVKVKEYSFEEVIARIKEGQTYKCTKDNFNIERIIRNEDGIFIESANEGTRIGILNEAKFTLVQQPITFMEAAKAFRGGKIVRCEYASTLDGKPITTIFTQAYKDEPGIMSTSIDWQNTLTFYTICEGKWFIDED